MNKGSRTPFGILMGFGNSLQSRVNVSIIIWELSAEVKKIFSVWQSIFPPPVMKRGAFSYSFQIAFWSFWLPAKINSRPTRHLQCQPRHSRGYLFSQPVGLCWQHGISATTNVGNGPSTYQLSLSDLVKQQVQTSEIRLRVSKCAFLWWGMICYSCDRQPDLLMRSI